MGRKERRALERAQRKEDKKTRREDAGAFALPEGMAFDAYVAEKRQAFADALRVRASGPAAEEGYAWMTNLLPRSPGLQVGTGTGESTLALARKGWRIVAVDENVACLTSTHGLLAEHGVSSELELRGRVAKGPPRSGAREQATGAYDVEYAGAPALREAQVTLWEGDVLEDIALDKGLVDAAPFDAVAAWLIDTHEARFLGRALCERQLRTAVAYRHHLEGVVYELAGRTLREGGVLHIVERRSDSFGEHAAGELLRRHRDHARAAALDFDALDATKSSEGALVSVRARKAAAAGAERGPTLFEAFLARTRGGG